MSVPAEHIAQDAADAHTAAVEDLLNPVADPAALTDEGAPVAGQHTHLAKRLRRHMARGGQGELAHPRKGITVVECFRPIEVVLDGTVVASTRRARRLDETDLPARYYIPPEDVRTGLLVPSETRTRCPYKGEAVYWSAHMPERTVEDVVWSYPRPIAECPRIASLMCFFNEVMDTILIDGVAEPKTRTEWSRD